MCKNYEHRFRVEVIVSTNSKGSESHCVAVDAIGMAAAISKADYWATENFPGADWIECRCHHSAYSSIQSAIEHGAIHPADNTMKFGREPKDMSVPELQRLIQKASEELAARAMM